jgi:hypothetical protein
MVFILSSSRYLGVPGVLIEGMPEGRVAAFTEAHRNQCVFRGSSPSVAVVLHVAREEILLWTMAGAKGLSFLQAIGPPGCCLEGCFLGRCNSVTGDVI